MQFAFCVPRKLLFHYCFSALTLGEIMDLNTQRSSSAIPSIRIDLVEDDDFAAELNKIPKMLSRKKRHSCPSDWLSVPNEREVVKTSWKEEKLKHRPVSPKKDLTKGIGMYKILEAIEKRKLKGKRRSRIRKERALRKHSKADKSEKVEN